MGRAAGLTAGDRCGSSGRAIAVQPYEAGIVFTAAGRGTLGSSFRLGRPKTIRWVSSRRSWIALEPPRRPAADRGTEVPS